TSLKELESPEMLFLEPKATSNTFIPEINDTLDLLQLYSNQLDNSRMPLKEIVPTLTKLSSQVNGLTQQFSEQQVNDPELQNIIEHLNMTIRLEQFKFERGDYV
ncbi:MAG: hypothetical protein HQK77_22365, partial [Desulfobacterales bacterium]|nr:hypothetical protein [Desulfobacterales bacterium]